MADEMKETRMIDTRVYRVTPSFYDDHVARDCDGGTVLKRTRAYVEIECDRAAYDDLHSDAVYFGDPAMAEELIAAGSMSFGGAHGIVKSAATMLRRLEEVGPPEPLLAEEAARRAEAERVELAEAKLRTEEFRRESDARWAEYQRVEAEIAARLAAIDNLDDMIVDAVMFGDDIDAAVDAADRRFRESSDRELARTVTREEAVDSMVRRGSAWERDRESLLDGTHYRYVNRAKREAERAARIAASA